jgi:hypothetical protein
MSNFNLSGNLVQEQRRHESMIVNLLLQRFQLPKRHKVRMLAENEQCWGERFLSLDVFFEFFPTFPMRLVSVYPFDLWKVMNEDVLFKKFGRSKLVEIYDDQYRSYVEPGEENRLPPRDRLLLGLPTFVPPPDTFGVVFQSRFDLRGGLVLHNHLIDVDVPGSRLLWISERGQQLVLEPLDVLLDSIDNAAPGGEGWTPDCGLTAEVEIKRGRKTEAEVETEAVAETETADEYAVCA